GLADRERAARRMRSLRRLRRGVAVALALGVVSIAVAVAALVLAAVAAGHVQAPVRAGADPAVAVHRLERNVAHDAGAVRWIERHRRGLSSATRRELSRRLVWHERALEWQRRRLDVALVGLGWLDAVDVVDRHLGSG